MKDVPVGLCWGTVIQADLPTLIDVAGRHGFPTITVRPDMVLEAIDAGIGAAALRRRLRDAGVSVRVIDAIGAGLPGGRPPATVRPDGVVAGSAATCFEIADALDAPIVGICHYADFAGTVPPLAAMIDAVGAIAVSAQARGRAVVMEFVPATGIPDIHAATAIARGVGMANCGILIDPWHLDRTGGGVAEVRAVPPGLIGALQLDDRTPPPPGSAYVPMAERDLPGEGRLPLHDLCAAALDNNPSLTAEVEVFSDALRALPPDAAAARVRRAVDAWRAAAPPPAG